MSLRYPSGTGEATGALRSILMILQTFCHCLASAPASRLMMTAAAVAKVIRPCKRAPRRRLDPSRLEHDRERHSALRENAVARSHTNSASLYMQMCPVHSTYCARQNFVGAIERHMISLSIWFWFLANPVSRFTRVVPQNLRHLSLLSHDCRLTGRMLSCNKG